MTRRYCRKHHMSYPMRQRGCFLCPTPSAVNVTGKDKLWDFTTQHIQPGTRITSKKQWQTLLKEKQLTDDLTTKEVVEFNVGGGAEKRHAQVRREQFEATKRYYEKVLPQFGSDVKKIPQEFARMLRSR